MSPVAGTSPQAGQPGSVLPGQVAKHKLQYTFVRGPQPHRRPQSDGTNSALNEKGFIKGDMVILSIEGEVDT